MSNILMAYAAARLLFRIFRALHIWVCLMDCCGGGGGGTGTAHMRGALMLRAHADGKK